jgi:hydroxyquinol 1,2-dioxygenase
MVTRPDDDLTAEAVRRWATADSPRTGELMTALVRHLHAYAREVGLTADEWMAAVSWLTRTGQISDDKRQEFILASDVLGLSSLVVELNNRFDQRATPATVLGPFHIDGSPVADYGFDMSDGLPGTPLFIVGRVTSLDGRPVPHAVLDVWQADVDGMYESQLPEVDEARLRARFRAREDGSYCMRTIVPLGYTIPMDGPVGELIGRTAISAYRPAHVHFLLDEPGYDQLVTHLFPAGTDHLESDVVFGVKDALVTPFVEHGPGPGPDGTIMDRPFVVARYDFVLQPSGEQRHTRLP